MTNTQLRTGKRFLAKHDMYPNAEWVGITWYYPYYNAWMAAAQLYIGNKPLQCVIIQEPRKRHINYRDALLSANQIAKDLSIKVLNMENARDEISA